MAQLAEQLTCNQQVVGSIPIASSNIKLGGVPEWPKGADCKSVAICFSGSNPLSSTTKRWAHSSAGRASALQAEGHRFDPCCFHHKCGSVAQLVRVPACHAGGRGFESLLGRCKFFLLIIKKSVIITP